MTAPLYEILRPKALSDVFGQAHLTSQNGYLTRIMATNQPVSLLFWGPPGCGKTTIAKIFGQAFNLPFVAMTGVLQTTADLKNLLKEAQDLPLFRRKTIVFFDEIHRLNRAQQDLFLPFLEDGSLVLIGATTENPSFALNNALLSRLRVLEVHPLTQEALHSIFEKCSSQHEAPSITDEAKEWIIALSQGDARHLMNLIETLHSLPRNKTYCIDDLAPLVQKKLALYDKDREGHYNLISALHKSVRGSDPDAAIYWLARMLEGGEDPLFLARRIVRMASEDIGLTDPAALQIALAAFQTYQMLGSPEGELALAQAVVYLALAPKSNALYVAYKKSRKVAAQTSYMDPPKTILNAPTTLMKDLGYSEGYMYDHDTPDAFSGQNYFPEGMDRLSFYEPVERGFEREMKKRLDYFTKLRNKH